MNNNNIIVLGYIPKTENGGDGKAHQSNLVYDRGDFFLCNEYVVCKTTTSNDNSRGKRWS